MYRISSTSYFDQTISNIQSSYEKLVKLQNQVQTQEAMERPSDDPVRANQALMLESSMKEIEQYMRNIQSGSDLLSYSDQMIDSLMVPLNTAIEKAAQGLNAENDATSRSAIANELNSILDTFISIGNTQLNDRNVFGGSAYFGDVFTRLGSDILFNGNNETYDVGVANNETIQSNLTAGDIFGTSSTIIDSERNLDPRLSEMSFQGGLPVNKIVNNDLLKVNGRNAAILAFSKAGATTLQKSTLKTAMDLFTQTEFASMGTYLDAVRDQVSIALGTTSSALSATESDQVKQVLDAVSTEYADSSTSLVLQADRDVNTAQITITLNNSNSLSSAAVVETINKARLQATGIDGSGNIDHSNTAVNARMDVLSAFKRMGDQLGITAPVDLATQVDLITVDGTTTSETYMAAIKTAAIAAFGVADYASMDAQQKLQTDAAVQAGKNAFSATEFSAVSTRSGLSITHEQSDLISVDTGKSDGGIVHALELGQSSNSSIYRFQTGDLTNLGADRTLTLTTASGSFLNIELLAGDTAEVIARRINRAVNQMTVPTDLRKVVANVDSTSGNDRLVLSGSSLFRVSVDDNTEISNSAATQFNSLNGVYRSIDDLRGGEGITTGTQKIMANNLVTGFESTITILEGDSLEYVMQQLENLAGFEASLNTTSDGLQLINTARYALDSNFEGLTIANGSPLIFATSIGLSKTINISTTTLSEQAEEINAQSSSSFRFHAEVNADKTGLIISSNESFTVDDGIIPLETASDLSALQLIDSKVLTGLGLNRTPGTKGVISGESLLSRQVRLSELNDGLGITKGSIRISLGSSTADVDLSRASTLRDVKVLMEAALPGLITVELNDAANGLSVKSVGSTPVRLEELFGGSTGRTLGLIKAPANSVTSTDIQGRDINPQFSGATRLKDLNGGRGLDASGFTIKNGELNTVITLDSNGDGVDDIRTLEDLVNHINQVSKQDNIYIKASIDAKKGGLKIVSQLANTTLEISERVAKNTSYRTSGIPATLSDTLTIFSGDRTKSVSIDVSTAIDADSMASLINTTAFNAATNFGFRAVVDDSGTVQILSHEAIQVSDSTTTYSTGAFSPNPPVLGKMASDLGLLGAFSSSTQLSSLNSGTGIEHGSFMINYGSVAVPDFSLILGTTTESFTFYNENASQSVTVVDPSALTALETTDLTNLGITVTDTGTQIIFKSTQRFSAFNNVSNLDIPIQYKVNTLAYNAKKVTVDLEFAETLGEVKKAIEEATNGEILVSFGRSNRLELRLASGDETQRITVEELNGSLDVAGTLGLIHPSVVQGRELRDGSADILSSATLLSDLGLNLNPTVNARSGENDLVLLSFNDSTTLDLSNARTVGDVISLINRTKVSDNGNVVEIEAKIVNGRYLSITNNGSGSLSVLNSSFGQAAEKLGLTPDPQLTGESHYIGSDLSPSHQAENFFSALTTLRDEFARGVISESVVSNTLSRLQQLQANLLSARGEAGGRITRFDMIQTRYEDESVFVEGLYGDKTGIDIISVTQRYLAQQQAYESGLSVASRILGTSLFSYI